MRRPVFTEDEIECIISMIGIASSGPEGEGDYQEFDYKSMRSAYGKLISYQGANMAPSSAPQPRENALFTTPLIAGGGALSIGRPLKRATARNFDCCKKAGKA